MIAVLVALAGVLAVAAVLVEGVPAGRAGSSVVAVPHPADLPRPSGDTGGSGADTATADRNVIAVLGSDLADPYVLTVGAVSYAYGTNTEAGGNVPVLSSTDLRAWNRVGDALPTLPGWAADTGLTTWAPAVSAVDDGYDLYYATRVAALGIECVSVAHATGPAGPFTDSSTGPLICQESEGGSIDPSPFSDGGERYLTWKSEGIRPGTTPALWAQRLSADGRSLVGTPARLLGPDLPWQDGVVEGPAMLARDGTFTLFYSAGDWHSPTYATGTAACAGPLGPCTENPQPMLRTGDAGVGPGGAEPFRAADGSWWLAFHTWTRRQPAAWPHADRQLVLVPLTPTGAPTITADAALRAGRVTRTPGAGRTG
ncbi:glycoside hydrolase family 43 protein [Frankia sp. AgB32]|uniref:glycoside hydrolase family 43 protein n=1 Tax=Frankia sp. AgB32 TaxID=631119 RepID=UPI00200D8303|nr:glycoside hydrolase family 43 protein [Frankia sp. AgB32]MCK9896697.1 glycoside hydrolase family 43 protein [Frankia sp. AgB32]